GGAKYAAATPSHNSDNFLQIDPGIVRALRTLLPTHANRSGDYLRRSLFKGHRFSLTLTSFEPLAHDLLKLSVDEIGSEQSFEPQPSCSSEFPHAFRRTDRATDLQGKCIGIIGREVPPGFLVHDDLRQAAVGRDDGCSTIGHRFNRDPPKAFSHARRNNGEIAPLEKWTRVVDERLEPDDFRTADFSRAPQQIRFQFQ